MSSPGSGFASPHLDSLSDSGITTENASKAGITSLSAGDAEKIGFRSSGMYIPYWDPASQDVNGFFRFRLDDVEPKGPKYLQAKGSGSRLYFAPLTMNDGNYAACLTRPEFPLFIVEGEKKALSLQQRIMHRGLVVGVGGVWNWCKKERLGGGPRPLIDDFDNIALKGRKVYIVYDSDVATNAHVRKGEDSLARSLRAAGSEVRLCTVPPGSDGEKYGLDDCLREWGEDWETPLVAIVRAALAERVDIPPIIQMGQMLLADYPEIKVILGEDDLPLLNSGGLCYVHSTSGVGKTYFTLQMAHSLSTGRIFLGAYPVRKPRRCLFLQAELSSGWFQRRVRSLNEMFGSTDKLWLMNGQMDLAVPAAYGKYEVNLAPLEEIIKNYRADVIFIDPLQGYLDIPENSTDVNREFQRQLSRLRHRYECAIVLTHHDRKSGQGEGMHRMRGSSVLADWADVVLSLEREVIDDRVVPHTLLLNWDKARHAEGPRPDVSRLQRLVSPDGGSAPWLTMAADQVFGNAADDRDPV